MDFLIGSRPLDPIWIECVSKPVEATEDRTEIERREWIYLEKESVLKTWVAERRKSSMLVPPLLWFELVSVEKPKNKKVSPQNHPSRCETQKKHWLKMLLLLLFSLDQSNVLPSSYSAGLCHSHGLVRTCLDQCN